MEKLDAHLDWIKKICKSMENRCPQTMDSEDLWGYAIIGFYDAVKKYDPALSSFKTYAEHRIRGSIGDGIRLWSMAGRRNREISCLSIEGEYSADVAHIFKENDIHRNEKQKILFETIDLIKRLPCDERIIMMFHICYDWPLLRIQEAFGLSSRYVTSVERRARKRIAQMKKES